MKKPVDFTDDLTEGDIMTGYSEGPEMSGHLTKNVSLAVGIMGHSHGGEDMETYDVAVIEFEVQNGDKHQVVLDAITALELSEGIREWLVSIVEAKDGNDES